MDKAGVVVGDLFEQAQNTGVQAVKSSVSDTFQSVQGQMGMPTESALAPNINGQQQLQEERARMLEDFYGPSDISGAAPEDADNPDNEAQQNLAKVRGELQDIVDPAAKKARQDLHNQVYVEPTFNPPPKKEESVSERLERQNQEESVTADRVLPPLVEVSTKAPRGTFVGVKRKKLMAEGKDLNSGG